MSTNWIITESKNYIFHYHKGSTADNEIAKIIKVQERCNKYILKV